MSDNTYTRKENIPTMLPIAEVVKRTGLSYYSLRNGCMSGEIVHIRCGSKYLINFDKLIEKMNGGRTDTNGED